MDEMVVASVKYRPDRAAEICMREGWPILQRTETELVARVPASIFAQAGGPPRFRQGFEGVLFERANGPVVSGRTDEQLNPVAAVVGGVGCACLGWIIFTTFFLGGIGWFLSSFLGF